MTTKIKITDIIVKDRLRKVDEAKVADLIQSISMLGGLIQPITVDKSNRLIGGAHRLEAYRRMGRKEIEVAILDCDGLHRELAEIDENLIRNDLHWLDAGEQAIRRDEILDELGLRAKAGDNQHSRGGARAAPPKKKTTAKIAKEIGSSERTLQENKQIAGKLANEAKKVVREMELTKDVALKISRLWPDDQRKVITKQSPEAMLEAIAKFKPAKQAKSGEKSSKKKADDATKPADGTTAKPLQNYIRPRIANPVT